jgi:ribonuclease HI
MILRVFADGGSRGNPGPAAAGFWVESEKGELIHREGIFLGRRTNNEAEYQAVLAALEWLRRNQDLYRPERVEFFLDSRLLVNQLNGNFRVKAANLRPLFALAKDRQRKLRTPVLFSFVPREKNYRADELVNRVLDEVESR